MNIEEAARKYADENSWIPEELHDSEIPDYIEHFAKHFIAGAEWQAKQSPWISVEEVLPPVGLDVIHTDINTVKRYYGQVNKVGTLVLGWTPHGEVTATHYMLIPQLTFDEILEANKDVLERIKEKED